MKMLNQLQNSSATHCGKVAILAMALFSVSPMVLAAETASSATVTITGTVVGNTCETAVGQKIDFGSINRTLFIGNLYKKPTKESVITLDKCGSAVNNVKVTVTGYGSNTAPKNDAAEGVSAVLFNDNTELKANEKSSAITLKAAGSGKSIELVPALRIDPAKFKAGKIVSSVSMNIEYQ